MKPAPFVRHVPHSLDEALKILAEVAPLDGRVLAGGQSLVPIMAFRLAKPAHLVDINEVAGLDRLESDGKTLTIGARVRHGAFHKSVVDNPLGKLLAAVVRHIAHYPIRMRGTFCGSLAHADPSSEWCLTAATLDAIMVAKSTRGERLIPAADFFEGLMSIRTYIDTPLSVPGGDYAKDLGDSDQEHVTLDEMKRIPLYQLAFHDYVGGTWVWRDTNLPPT